jgi:putative pyruvate formate lyase activating enzyme
MLDLQALGCVNINLVTPTHFTLPICEAIAQARDQGLRLPIVYNSGGYDAPDVLRRIEDFVDIYMPDMKYSDSTIASQLSQAPDYPAVNRRAILEMHRQVGDLQVVNGLAVRGLLVRHLVLPNGLAGSFEIVDFLANHVSPSTAINVMDQYRPWFKAHADPRLNHRPSGEEIESVRRYAVDKGLRIIE